MPANIVHILRERGLLQDVTDPSLVERCEKESLCVYIGFDPTADSLHVGHMVSILVLKHFQLAGHRPIAVVGGGTGMIGDPSGRSQERNLLTREDLARNIAGIRRNLSQFLSFEGDRGAKLLNNADWLASWTFLDFLRDVGKHFRLGDMLSKDSVKRRLESDAGLSYTEFSYMLLQAYDFKYLYENHGCTVQAGGSDQWGNITAGTELIRRTLGGQGYGITTPLLTNSEGQKMGKTANGAIWLDPARCSPYEFYQFWVRQDDRDVERFLRMLTFVPLPEIASLMEEHAKDPSARRAQKRLALEVTSQAHGPEEAEKARLASEALFGGGLANKTDEELRALFQDVPSAEVPRGELEAGLAVVDLLVRAGLVPSRNEAKRLLEQGGVTINNQDQPLPKEKRSLTPADLASPTMLVLRAGKKKYCLVRFA